MSEAGWYHSSSDEGFRGIAYLADEDPNIGKPELKGPFPTFTEAKADAKLYQLAVINIAKQELVKIAAYTEPKLEKKKR